MNYPIWEVGASGLVIAFIAVVHVFVSHFAVGGGLFLVLAEMKARREGDGALLAYVKRHSRFFILLTLVFGAITGVGIWFAITLVHPAATSSLINTFVWGWAIEWTFFAAEIAAAMIYYYGWDRLSARAHVAVGWIYFVAAWASLAIINGILSYMLTPGSWVVDRGFWSGFLNPTYLPSLVMRTFVAFGLAGLYALLTVSWTGNADLKRKIARYAGLRWVIPMGVAVPLGLIWYLVAASGAGVPAGEILGADGNGVAAVVAAVFGATGESGHPIVQTAAFYAILASGLVLLLTLFLATVRSSSFGRVSTAVLMLLGLVSIGGGEWVREGLRKPYVIGRYMFVNGARLPAPENILQPAPEDAFALDALARTGVLAASPWFDAPEGFPGATEAADLQAEAGRQVFRVACTSCHTLDGYLAVRPLVEGKSVAALEKIVSGMATPVDADGRATSWSDPGVRLATWRGRRMPPFPGSEDERLALAIYLARLGGEEDAGVDSGAGLDDPGARYYDDNCAMCHAADADFPMDDLVRGQAAGELYGILGRLDEINDMMPPFDGTDEERRALAEYLAGLGRVDDAGEDRP